MYSQRGKEIDDASGRFGHMGFLAHLHTVSVGDELVCCWCPISLGDPAYRAVVYRAPSPRTSQEQPVDGLSPNQGNTTGLNRPAKFPLSFPNRVVRTPIARYFQGFLP